MTPRQYIQVILPLRLGWEPFYALPQGTQVALGSRVKVRFAGKAYGAVVSRTGVTPQMDTSKIQSIISVEEDLEAVTPNEIEFWRFLSSYYMCTLGEVFAAAYPEGRLSDEKTANAIRERREEAQRKALEKELKRKETLQSRIASREEKLAKARKDSVRQRLQEEITELKAQLEKPEAPQVEMQDITPARITLTKAQQNALEAARKAFSQGRNVLLQGITGAGKTEVYLALAREVISSGRNVLYLAPEIAMSVQLSSRIEAIFPGRFFLYNSAESFASRRRVTEGISQGGYIVLGTRSALLLPHRDLGLIIVDEEHESSYKQESPAPRYNGRDSALMLAKIHGCPVILGSATPSLESLYNCRTGKFELVTLSQRYFGGADSEVELIDCRAEARKNGMVGSFSRKLISHIHKTLEGGGQVIILRARRAYSPAVQCRECGEIVRCPSCNVALSYHIHRRLLQCHYCGHTEPFTGTCPKCGGELVPLGAGTQKIEEEARSLFPDAVIERLDSDVPKTQARAIIRSFENGSTHILIGTQILAKGFDFGNVALTVMLQGDSLLTLEDFRADEKALQLLMQLRGRSGRRGGTSRLVIQTSQPDHPVYAMLRGGAQGAETQFAERKEFGYPPFTRVILLTVKDTDLQRLESTSQSLARDLAEAVPGLEISGPYAPAVDKIANSYIRHIRLTLPRDARLAARKEKIATLLAGKAYLGKVTADVDPA